MKYLKMLGPAAIAAMVLTAVIAATSASAAVLCKSNTNPCTEIYPAGTKISASLSSKSDVQLTTSIGTVTCIGSTISGELTAGNPAHGKITSVTFSGCSLGSTNCVAEGEGTPYTATVWTGSQLGNGDLIAEPYLFDKLHLGVACGSLINCTFGTSSISMVIVGGMPARLVVSQSYAREGGLCPAAVTWEAEYTVTAPSPLVVI
jgi:hypothetical protein